MTRSPGRSTPRSRPAAGSPHGGVFLDIASRRTPEFIRKRLPSMYHQFKELADVDITAEPMEIGPTCHYVMGGVEVDARHRAERASPACTPSASAPAACTAPTGSAATRCPTCWSSAGAPARPRRRTPAGWATRPDGRRRRRQGGRAAARWRRSRSERRREPVHDPAGPPADDERPGRHHPHRRASSSESLEEIEELKERAEHARGRGPPAVQPRLAPRDRPAQHAAGLGVHRQGGARARRSRAAATPATTSRARTPSGAPRTSCCRSTTTGDGGRPEPAAAAGDARRAEEVLRARHGRGRTATDGLRPEDAALARRRRRAASSSDYTVEVERARWCSTRSTACRPPRPATSRCAGTARPASAARAAPRSTAGRGCCA